MLLGKLDLLVNILTGKGVKAKILGGGLKKINKNTIGAGQDF